MTAETDVVESPVEARIARLESDVSHLRSDVTEIKIDVRSVRDKIDSVGTRLDAKIDDLARHTSDRFDQMNARFVEVKDEIASAKIWGLSLYITLSAVMLATMARGFGWI